MGRYVQRSLRRGGTLSADDSLRSVYSTTLLSVHVGDQQLDGDELPQKVGRGADPGSVLCATDQKVIVLGFAPFDVRSLEDVRQREGRQVELVIGTEPATRIVVDAGDGREIVEDLEALRAERRHATDRDAEPDADGVIPREWDTIVECVTAAAAGADDFAREVKYLEDVPLNAGRTVLYLIVLVRAAAANRIAGEPDEAQVRELADQLYPAWRANVNYDRSVLDDTVLTAFELAEDVPGPLFTVNALAVLGALLDDPVSDLAALRPELASWWVTNEASLTAAGVYR